MEKIDWPRSAVLILAKKWEEHECLYNRSHENYNSKQARYEALSIIAEEMSEDFPLITIDVVRNKMHYLRGQYTREVSKMKRRRSLAGKGGDYVPTAFWFSKLGFLSSFIQSRNCIARKSLTDDSLHYLRDPCDPLETGGTPIKMLKVEDSQCSNFEYDIELESKTQEVPQCESMAESSYSSYENLNSPLDTTTNAVNTNVRPKKKSISKSDSFAEFLKVEFTKITDQAIYDEMMENIMQCVFDAKKKQRQTNNSSD